VPILHIEQLKFDIVQKLKEVKAGDHVIFFVDSIGNLASKKEVDDAENENEAADMSRAKAIKSLFRIITPHFTIKDIPALIIAHVYDEQKMYGKTIVSGGTGIMLSSNNVWILGRSQEKDGTDLTGYKFSITIDKSRFVKEKSKFEFSVSFDGGINRWSGLLALAVESGHVIKPSNGWYQKNGEDTKCREADTNNIKFWGSILTDKTFNDFVRGKYQLAVGSIMTSDEK
jgi:RecA/RadA recombinase